MRNIELLDEKYYSCFQVAIATYLKNNDYNEYWYAFPNCWVFDYKNDDDILLYERVNGLWISDAAELKKYAGIMLKETTTIEDDIVYLIEIDAADCRWGTVYEKYHIPHYFLLQKQQNDKIIIVDSFFKKKIETLADEVDTSIFKKIFRILKYESTKCGLPDIIRMAVLNMFPDGVNVTGYEKMRKLAIDILECNYPLDVKTQKEELYMNRLYNNFFQLEAGRYNLLQILSNDLKFKSQDVYIALKQIVSSWEVIRLNIARLLLTDNIRLLENISKALKSLSYKEEDVLNKLCKLYKVGEK